MKQNLASSPDFHIRPLETLAEIEQYFLLNAKTFSSDENTNLVASFRHHFVVDAPDFQPGQLRGAFLGNVYLGGYIIYERWLCIGSARLLTGCIAGVVTHPDYRNQGIARAMMHEALAYARSRQHALLLLHGIPNFYGQLGFIDCLEDFPRHLIERKLIPAQSSGDYIVRSATVEDASSLLTLYQKHYSSYLASFAPTRTLERQQHFLCRWMQESLPLITLNSANEAEGYLLLTRRQNVLKAYEVAANTWPAALALMQYHFQLLDVEAESSAEIHWPLPPGSSTYYLLADHLPLHSEAYSYPDTGWMARPADLPALFGSLLPVWRERWQSRLHEWSGILALKVEDQHCFLELSPEGISIIEHATNFNYEVSLSQQVLTQLLFGFRPISWFAGQFGLHEEFLPLLETLFPVGPSWFAQSDSF